MDLGALLAAVENAAPVDVVDALGQAVVGTVRADHVALLIANFSGSALVRLSHVSGSGIGHVGGNERAETVPLPGTIYERVVFSQVREVVRDGDQWLILVPVTERGDAIGLLEVAFSHEPDADALAQLDAATHALAYALIATRRHTDLFEWAQRDIPFSIAAEIQRRLLPSTYTVEAGPLTLSGWLEPAYDAGGDTFDYSLDREYLYVTVTDAMGHSTNAALLATLTVGTLRNRRRGGATAAELAEAANDVLHAHAAPDQFVTGLILRARLADGATEIVNAGHPAPFLIRAGTVVPLELASHPPFGVGSAPYQADTVLLEPGDRLLLVTDGYLDRLAGRLDIEQILTRTLERHPRQLVQELARGVLRVTDGQLRDDATCLCLDWYGGVGQRDATGGASRARATATR